MVIPVTMDNTHGTSLSCAHKLHFCTYFDHSYLPRALILHETLKKNSPNSILHILCLTSHCREILNRMELANVTLTNLSELEEATPDLLATKQIRSASEYIFTLSPAWIRYVLCRFAGIGRLTYVDADAAFFSSPVPFLEEMTASIGIVPHRFPPHMTHLSCFGLYNVGWNTFANDAISIACLNWWHEKCIEWCYDFCDDNRFADQGYLNDWPALFGAVEIENRGINVGPWNVGTFSFSEKDGRIFVNEDPLIFFHFQQMRRLVGPFYDAGVWSYQNKMPSLLRREVYIPYLNRLLEVSREIKNQDGLYSERSALFSSPKRYIQKLLYVVRVLASGEYLFGKL